MKILIVRYIPKILQPYLISYNILSDVLPILLSRFEIVMRHSPEKYMVKHIGLFCNISPRLVIINCNGFTLLGFEYYKEKAISENFVSF